MFCESELAVRGQSYRSVLLAYSGGDTGRTAALHKYQRALRLFQPGRDGLLLSNTWGDRSKESKLNDGFIRREIDAGKALGVDVVEIDDGWQQGRTTGFGSGGIWEGYWKSDPHFWNTDKNRFPGGLANIVSYAHVRGVKLGLWFAPDSSDDFANWRKDAEELLTLNKAYGVDAFKLDSVKIRSERSEENYHAILDRVTTESAGKLLLDLDVTAETRQGYFGAIAAGPIFVENRYTDNHSYWPHQTLRTLWELAHYVDPPRLRIEFLNSERNSNLYQDDPLAPIHYTPSSLFAIAMFSSPLAWLETSGLSKAYMEDASPIIATWKKERKTLYQGTILPIGDAPDGVTWTGFASVADKGLGGYLLLFRELNAESTWVIPSSLFANQSYRIQILGGDGTVVKTASGIRAIVPHKLGFVWAKVEPGP
jgi:alpha-galactosidase